MPRILAHFLLWFLSCAIAGVLMTKAFGVRAPSGSGLVVVFAGALLAGTLYARRHGSVPSKRFAWSVGVWLTLVPSVLVVSIKYALGSLETAHLFQIGPEGIAGAVVALAINVALIRFAFRWGASSALRGMARA